MQIFDKIFENSGSIDGITIINLNGDILFSAKFNNQLHNYSGNYEMVGKNFKDIYPNLSSKNSTLLQCIELGKPVYIKSQKLEFYDGHCIYINSLSIPIRHGGKIVGAIDISTEEFKENMNFNSYSKKENYIPIEEQQFDEIIRKFGNSSINTNYKIDDIITNNIEMIRMKKFIKEICDFNISVLITGETGTGKELIAHSLHTESKRCNKPFIAQNCAAIPESLIESELFGYEGGSFTGAKQKGKIGKFQLADQGTIFLDEIGDMSPTMQAKLLRTLETGEIEKIGNASNIKVNVRVIAATNQNLEKKIKEGNFREDLYYRLSTITFEIPPLRERNHDIILLINNYLNYYNKKYNKNLKISSRAYSALLEYNWPGNIRELKNCIEHAVILTNNDCIYLENLPKKFQNDVIENKSITLEGLLNKKEKEIILNSLINNNWNKEEVAKKLGIGERTLYRKIKKYRINCQKSQ